MRRRVIPLVAIAVLLAACDAGSPASPVPSPPAPAGPATASVADGRFRLDFELPRSQFTTDEAIDGVATLSLVRPGAGKIGASGGGPMMFGVRELGGRREMGPAADAACGAFDIADAAPITSRITKSGGWDPQAPDAAFYEAFFRDQEFRLPPGTWEITAYASFAEGADCAGPSHDMRAPIRILVTPAR